MKGSIIIEVGSGNAANDAENRKVVAHHQDALGLLDILLGALLYFLHLLDVPLDVPRAGGRRPPALFQARSATSARRSPPGTRISAGSLRQWLKKSA